MNKEVGFVGNDGRIYGQNAQGVINREIGFIGNDGRIYGQNAQGVINKEIGFIGNDGRIYGQNFQGVINKEIGFKGNDGRVYGQNSQGVINREIGFWGNDGRIYGQNVLNLITGSSSSSSSSSNDYSPPPPPPKKPVPAGATAESLTERGFLFLEDENYKEAGERFDSALDINPKYAKAYVGLLCLDLEVKKEADLANLEKPFADNQYFKKAVRFADNYYRAKLERYNSVIVERIAEKEKLDLYNSLVKDKNKAEQKSERDANDFRRLAEKFREMGDYKESLALAEECENLIPVVVEEARIAEEKRKEEARIAKEKRLAKKESQKAELEKILASLRESKKLRAQRQAELQRQYNDDYKTWQENVNQLKNNYDIKYNEWLATSSTLKTQSEQWRAQGLCPHCGGALKGLFSKKCGNCAKSPAEPLHTPPPPSQPNYPREPNKPNMPVFKPQTLDESKYVLKDDLNSAVNQRITLAGIEWRIIAEEDDKLLLITENVIEKRAYHAPGGSVTWEDCTLHEYLNGEFYNRLSALKHAIAETHNSNPDNLWYGTKGGNATKDKIFLLSLEEIDKYFGNSGDYLNKRRKDYGSGEFYLANGGWYFSNNYDKDRVAKFNNKNYCYYWLRSAGRDADDAANVSYGGDVIVRGGRVNSGRGGVRPAMWIRID